MEYNKLESLSSLPKIMSEAGTAEAHIWFNPDDTTLTKDDLQALGEYLDLNSSGGVSLLTQNFDIGLMIIYNNPTKAETRSLQWAIDIVAKAIKTSCPESDEYDKDFIENLVHPTFIPAK